MIVVVPEEDCPVLLVDSGVLVDLTVVPGELVDPDAVTPSVVVDPNKVVVSPGEELLMVDIVPSVPSVEMVPVDVEEESPVEADAVEDTEEEACVDETVVVTVVVTTSGAIWQA